MQQEFQSADASAAGEGALDGASAFDPVEYINRPRWRSSRLGLDRTRELMERLGNPQRQLKIVHVAGTNGKGSTSAFAASILQHAGFRTGLFTSPYIIEFSDRIRVDGENISADDLRAVTLEVRDQAEAMEDHPTEFELMTAVALLHFARSGCDFAVLEVGLGGRLDSTNIIDAPEVCAICPIALDHTDWLGDTIEAIAAEKAGIIKPGASVVCAVQEPKAYQVISSAARDAGCNMRSVDAGGLSGVPQDFSYDGIEHLSVGLLGSYQTQNASLAIEIVRALRERGFDIDDQALRDGLAAARWPGRFEVVAHHPDFIIDGGHNAQGAHALVSSLELNYPGRQVVFLVGILADKDYPSMLQTVVSSGFGCSFVCVTPPNPRALDASDLARAVCDVGRGVAGFDDDAVETADSFEAGVARARQIAGKDGVVCAFGSLYSIADIMSALRKQGMIE